MFEKFKLSEWLLEDYGSEFGVVQANYDFLKNNQLGNIFVKDNTKYELLQVGNMDFKEVDAFIKKAMNSFYATLNSGTEEEIERKKSDYKHLFEIWESINLAKKNNSSNLSDLYNDLLFALHMMGYKR